MGGIVQLELLREGLDGALEVLVEAARDAEGVPDVGVLRIEPHGALRQHVGLAQEQARAGAGAACATGPAATWTSTAAATWSTISAAAPPAVAARSSMLNPEPA